MPGNGPKVWSPRTGRDERIRKRRSQYHCWIDVSALLAIFFVLLFIVILAAPSTHNTHGVGVDLPRSDHSSWMTGALREDSMRVAITRDGRVYFGSRQISLNQVPDKVCEGLRGGAENRVYVLADARARYREVKMVLDRIRQSGVQRVSFLTVARPQ